MVKAMFTNNYFSSRCNIDYLLVICTTLFLECTFAPRPSSPTHFQIAFQFLAFPSSPRFYHCILPLTSINYCTECTYFVSCLLISYGTINTLLPGKINHLNLFKVFFVSKYEIEVILINGGPTLK